MPFCATHHVRLDAQGQLGRHTYSSFQTIRILVGSAGRSQGRSSPPRRPPPGLGFAQAAESAAPSARSRRAQAAPQRLCLGLFAAADALGFGFVHGVAPLVYLERFEPVVLERLGLSLEALSLIHI